MGSCDIFEHRKKTGDKAGADYTDADAERFAREAGIEKRPAETSHEIDERGAFIRQANVFTQPFGDQAGELKAEANRYAIYWATGCHWSNRPMIVRDLLGLDQVIGSQKTAHSGQSNLYGHGFDSPDHRDSLTGAYFLSEFYKRADPGFKGRATTPSFVDIIEKKVVNNDYHRLTNYLEVQFRPFQSADAPDLYPKKYRREIDEFNDWLFPHINNSHYRMAFCQSPEAYFEAYDDFYASLEQLEKRLSENRFLFGDYITDSDVRAYVTLVRWDVAYYHNVGPVLHPIYTYKNIFGYLKELNAIPEFHRYSNAHDLAFGSTPGVPENEEDSHELFRDFNHRILSKFDFEKFWKDDGSRAALSRTPNEKYLRHPEGETYEEYASEISSTVWNSPADKDRDPRNFHFSGDPAVNPISSKN